jgi:hypothetical protein
MDSERTPKEDVLVEPVELVKSVEPVELVENGGNGAVVAQPQKKRKITIRDARIHDIPQLEDMMIVFLHRQIELGNRLITKEPNHLKGGLVIELGLMYNDPMTKIIVAERNGELVGFLIGVLEFCDPVSRFLKCVRIKADYIEETSLARGLVLRKMWETLEDWAQKSGAGFFYGLIHPGNQSSIRVAKEVGFKHHTTQFVKIPRVEA